MSLIRQIRLLLVAVVVVVAAGSVAVNVLTVRDTLQTQLQAKNSDNAQALAMTLSQQGGDPKLMELAIAALFDTGVYRRVSFRGSDGSTLFERSADARPAWAPSWFVRALPIAAPPGVAQVSDRWRALGQVEVLSHTAYAHDALWRALVRSAGWAALVGVLAVLLGDLAMRRIRRPLAAAVEQAQALVEGRYVTVEEPHVAELRQLTAAMNGMVERVRVLFEAQAAQAETLRRHAHADPLTGVAHRAHFIERVQALLSSEDGFDGGGLVIVRLADLVGLNLVHGHETTDRALVVIAQTLQAYPERASDCIVGRLNGSDFALCLPFAGVTGDTASSIGAALRSSLPAIGPGIHAHVGAVALARSTAVGAALAQADLALARAESAGPFAVEVVSDMPGRTGRGERAWRAQIVAALDERRARLVEYPVIDRHGALSHLECPLRVQLDPGGEFDVAARWLPLAARSRLTGQVDLHGVRLALDAIGRDGRPRAVNIAAASLHDGAFPTGLRHLLEDAPRRTQALWLEVGEGAAVEHFGIVQELGRLVRPLGARFGLEHAGERLARIERLYELGLDYVKLDSATCAGVATQAPAREFVRSTVALLRALSIQVHAEGVQNPADVEALWTCGVDAVTGPWASSRCAV